MLRQNVYKLIDGERAYQDRQTNHSSTHDANHSVSDWIIFMEHQIQEAKEAIYFVNREEALKRIRKATALGVVCMENNETPPRV
ncbi:MAG TPA: hypothetical protein ENH82_06685 [bacterium]|nr:hypothetical protein [bacterium]